MAHSTALGRAVSDLLCHRQPRIPQRQGGDDPKGDDGERRYRAGGECRSVLIQGQRVELCGVDDPKCGGSMWSDQLSAAAKAADPDCLAVLLSHRPERVEDYLAYDFDLVLSGHAHGGQWRLPGLVNGLLAPDQGFFPAYAGGLYRLDENTDLVVSRGLARESTRVPRIFNPPELVIIDVTPAE